MIMRKRCRLRGSQVVFMVPMGTKILLSGALKVVCIPIHTSYYLHSLPARYCTNHFIQSSYRADLEPDSVRYLNRNISPGYVSWNNPNPGTGRMPVEENQYPAFCNTTSPHRDRYDDDVTPFRDCENTATATPSTDNTTSTGGTRRLREDPIREVLTQFLDIYQTNQYQLEKR